MMKMKIQVGVPKRMNMRFASWLAFLQICSAANWTYSGELGPSNWVKRYPDCGGMRQSPIDIVTKNVRATPCNKYDVKWNNYDKVPISMTLLNNGHSVQLNAKARAGQTPYLQINTRSYELDQIHFHWGKKDTQGSEHTINNKRYPLELHAVHRRTVNGTRATPDEIIVVTLLFQISMMKNRGIDHFVKYVPEVMRAETHEEIPPFAADTLVPPFKSFYFYEGSLTTPPCSEVVTFAIRKELARVSSSQMKLFRVALNDEGEEIAGNFRPIQPINNRTVHYVQE